MADLDIGISAMRYDIMLPLLEGRVPVEGVTFHQEPGSSMVFGDDPVLKNGDFGLRDLNLGFFLPAVEAGWEVVGLPVISKRKPVYTYCFVRTDRGINGPKDLEGKTVASGRYSSAITVWLRGFLQDRHGVDLSKVTWLVSGPDVFPARTPSASTAPAPDPRKSAIDCLLDGEVDAFMADVSGTKLWESLENNPNIKRLFPNYVQEDERLYKETGIVTPMHMMVMSRKLAREHPDLPGRLYDAFQRSKEIAVDDILSDMRGFGVLYLRERKREEMERWGDPWAHGVVANRRTFETFIDYNMREGMITRRPALEEFLAAGTLDT
jgi:4,5-dihydroxyphthalate decarboxylase